MAGAETLRLSPRWKAILGYSDSEIDARPDEWFRRIHPHDVDEFRRLVDAHLGGRSEVLQEFCEAAKAGRWRR